MTNCLKNYFSNYSSYAILLKFSVHEKKISAWRVVTPSCHFILLCPTAIESHLDTIVQQCNAGFQTPVGTLSKNKHTHNLPIYSESLSMYRSLALIWCESTLQIRLWSVTAVWLPSSHACDYPIMNTLMVWNKCIRGRTVNMKEAVRILSRPAHYFCFHHEISLMFSSCWGGSDMLEPECEKQNFTTARLALATWLDWLVIQRLGKNRQSCCLSCNQARS